jgi:hypothetical protein
MLFSPSFREWFHRLERIDHSLATELAADLAYLAEQGEPRRCRRCATAFKPRGITRRCPRYALAMAMAPVLCCEC